MTDSESRGSVQNLATFDSDENFQQAEKNDAAKVENFDDVDLGKFYCLF